MSNTPICCSTALITADQFFDRIPFASSVTNLVNIFQKSVFVPLVSAETKCHYYSHLRLKSFIRCLVLLVPVFGNLIIWVMDNYQNITCSIKFAPTFDSLEKIISKEIIQSEIGTYLTSQSLYPYVLPWKGVFQCDDLIEPILETETHQTVFVGGHFPLNESCTRALFCMQKNKTTNSFQTKLLFLTNGELISPELFYDIFLGPQLATGCHKVVELYQQKQKPQIYIDSTPPKKGKITQTWIFFTRNKSVDVEIRLFNDRAGSTTFAITPS